MTTDLATYVLAGGKSQRFGGDKARAAFGESTVLQTVVDQCVQPVLLVDSAGRYNDLLATRDVVDSNPGAGPAMAIATAIQDAKSRGIRRIRIVSCDMPTFEPRWWSALEASDAAAAAFHDGERWQPLFSTWDVEACLSAAEQTEGGPVWALLEAVQSEKVSPPLDWAKLISINTPDALAKAQEVWTRANHERHVHPVQVCRVLNGNSTEISDVVAVEEPLEIRLGFERKGRFRQQPVSITMRTPGHDYELALGFLAGERIINARQDVQNVIYCGDGKNQNVVRVELTTTEVDLTRLQRNFYTTSSCGVCGKSSLEALAVTGYAEVECHEQVAAPLLAGLPDVLRSAQDLFERTGGLHAAGLFDLQGNLLRIREDVGRHNALDKLVGASWRRGELPWTDRIVVLSGRASFELLQKSIAAGAPFVVAVGAPSSLAVELAEMYGVTLAGFTQSDRMNLYAHADRVI